MLSWTILAFVGHLGAIQGSPVVGPKVVNGTDATEGEFPFMVSLKSELYHFCGGSILNSQWILTAAHCVETSIWGEDYIQVYYGNVSLNDGPAAIKQKKIDVLQSVIHPDYFHTEISIRNDLALLQLARPLVFSDLVQPIKLPKQDEPVPINQTATLTGWGYIDSGVAQSPTLQKVNLTIFDYPYCDAYNSVFNFDNTQNICAGNLENTKGQCNGDSGGPLFKDGVQWGIVSWSLKPCISAPGVFTRTSIYSDWIKNVTGIQ